MHYETTQTDDQLFVEAARAAVEAARKRSEHNEITANIPGFIGVKRKGKGEASKCYVGFKTGMVFKKGEKQV